MTGSGARRSAAPKNSRTRSDPAPTIRRRPLRSAIRASGGPNRIEPTPNAAKISDTPPGDIPRFVVEYGPNVVIQPPYAAEKARFQSDRTNSGRIRAHRLAVTGVGATAMSRGVSTAAAIAGTSSVDAGSGGGGKGVRTPGPGTIPGSSGRNRIAAIAAIVAVQPTTMNGTRRLIAR